MRPDPAARPEFVAAFRDLAERIQSAVASTPKQALPIQMFVAGGAALHLYTGARVTTDIDAAFSHRIALPGTLDTSYEDADGAARWLHLDPNYNDTLALMHEDARDDALPLALAGIDPKVLDIRLLTPTDLAVSKVARFNDIDRTDIETLARRGLITAAAFRRRAEEAIGGYVGDLTRLRGSIEQAANLIADLARRQEPRRPPPKSRS
jgi:Nucleotidyltransferase of unknown function (DUF6036)